MLADDPLFNNPEADDYSLLPSSPCIGAGRYGADLGALPYGGTGIDENVSLPEKTLLISNYPNPFNASTTLSLELPTTGYFEIGIINILGQHVADIYKGYLDSGRHLFSWDSAADVNVTTGVYFAIAKSESGRVVHRMLLLK